MAKRRLGRRPWLVLATALLHLSGPAWATGDEGLDPLAHQLVALRSQVDRLQDQLEGLEGEHKSHLASLAQQRAEVEANLRRARLQVKQLQQALEEHRRTIQQAKEQDRTLIPALQQAIEAQRARIRAGLPFKVEQRLGVLEELQRDLTQGVITSAQAASRLWAFMEDEARLARESGLYRQPVMGENGEVLADVARLGLVALFYRSPDGTLGHLSRQGDGWQAVPITDGRGREQVATLFEALEKQVRSGFFSLPNALEVDR